MHHCDAMLQTGISNIKILSYMSMVSGGSGGSSAFMGGTLLGAPELTFTRRCFGASAAKGHVQGARRTRRLQRLDGQSARACGQAAVIGTRRQMAVSVRACGICTGDLGDGCGLGVACARDEAAAQQQRLGWGREKTVQLGCKHVFHDLCIRGWAIVGKKARDHLHHWSHRGSCCNTGCHALASAGRSLACVAVRRSHMHG